MRHVQPCHSARHGWGKIAFAGLGRFLARAIDIKAQLCGLWRDGAEIKKDELARLGIAHQHEAIAANIARTRQRDSQRKANCNGGIHSIAAFAQNAGADARGHGILRDDHALFTDDGGMNTGIFQQLFFLGKRRLQRQAQRHRKAKSDARHAGQYLFHSCSSPS